MKKMFDLNIEKILENWETYHAIREIIANAIDEQTLTNTKDIEIYCDSSKRWHIRDYGRGIKYEHLTQKENEEKLINPNLIGKFGIGLKDALATFDRNNIRVTINSRYGEITLGKSKKHDFEDITTLHAYVSPASEPSMIGTDFTLDGVTETDILMAKQLFLVFSKENIIEKNPYGDILKKSDFHSNIYLNGVKVAEEENFLFSYNITSLDSKIRKALNRERTNVGRSAYSDRIKSILKSTENKLIVKLLVDDLKNYSSGQIHDELKWIDVQEHAVKILNVSNKVVFLTPDELIDSPELVDRAKTEGYEIIAIPDTLKDKVQGQEDVSGNQIVDLNQFYKQYEDSFEFRFVDINDLSANEKQVLRLMDDILELIGGRPRNVNQIKISETMRNELGYSKTTGLWEPSTGTIILKRSVLSSTQDFAGTLIHEIVHASTGFNDVTRDFERELTKAIGKICAKFFTGFNDVTRDSEQGLIGKIRAKIFSS